MVFLNSLLKGLGFKPNRADHCLCNNSEYVPLLLYVDDVRIALSSEALTLKYVSIIVMRFRISYSSN